MVRLRALVFEDDSIFRTTLWQILDSRGYEVLTYPEPGFCPLQDTDVCVCPPDQYCADIIISDIDMPNMSGVEFVANQMKKGCRVKNIGLMSGGWSSADLKKAKTLGCRTFFKPFDLEELINWLKECENNINRHRILFNIETMCQ